MTAAGPSALRLLAVHVPPSLRSGPLCLHPRHVFIGQILKGMLSGPRRPPEVLLQGLLHQVGVTAGVLQDGGHAEGVQRRGVSSSRF